MFHVVINGKVVWSCEASDEDDAKIKFETKAFLNGWPIEDEEFKVVKVDESWCEFEVLDDRCAEIGMTQEEATTKVTYEELVNYNDEFHGVITGFGNVEPVGHFLEKFPSRASWEKFVIECESVDECVIELEIN
jgi:hypothetical protein